MNTDAIVKPMIEKVMKINNEIIELMIDHFNLSTDDCDEFTIEDGINRVYLHYCDDEGEYTYSSLSIEEVVELWKRNNVDWLPTVPTVGVTYSDEELLRMI